MCVSPGQTCSTTAPHVSAFFEYDQSTKSVILRPDKSYRKGEQVICTDTPDQHCMRFHAAGVRCEDSWWLGEGLRPWVDTVSIGNISEATLSAAMASSLSFFPSGHQRREQGSLQMHLMLVMLMALTYGWHCGGSARPQSCLMS